MGGEDGEIGNGKREDEANGLIECTEKGREDWEGTCLYYLLDESET